MPPVTQTGPCSQLPLVVILAPRARPRHNGFVVHAWLHRAGCRPVKTAHSWRGIVPFTHLAREGAHDSHHWTAEIAGRTRRRGGRVAACGARATILASSSAAACAPARAIA